MTATRLPAALLVAASFPLLARAENLLKNASFEQPEVKAPTEARRGGDPTSPEKETTWAHFMSMDTDGKIVVGLTNELSRTGKQSVFVDFKKATTKNAFLESDLIPVKAISMYRISIWGRLDRKRPLTLDQGRPVFRLEVDFYQADQETGAGDSQYRTQMIPGSPGRVLFFAGRWTEYFTEVRSPQGAEFMKITFHWEAPADREVADGMIYFDDAVVEGKPGSLVPSTDPVAPTPPAEPAAGTPATPAPPAAAK